MSTVSSTTYLVSDGYVGALTIQGDMGGITVSDLFDNINKADTAQILTVEDASGNAKELTDLVVGGDILKVVSANGENTSDYTLVNLPLDDNAVITAYNDPTMIVIETEGEAGSIKGVAYGDLLKDVLDSLVIPQTATVSIIDMNGALVPLKSLNFDTVMVDTRVGNSIFIEVLAQNGVNMITYQFEPDALSSDAFVISSVFDVDQENLTISDIRYGLTAQSVWSYIEVVKGASATLVDKGGNERTEGLLNYDDRLVIISEDGSTTVVYYLGFLNELNPDVKNFSPEVSITGDASVGQGVAVTYEGAVTDDGLPEGSVLSYLWEVTAGDAATVNIANNDQATTEVTFSEAGDFDLSLTVSDGDLSKTAVQSVTVNPVGVGEMDMSKISIYPNPAGENVHVEFGASSVYESQIRIVDMLGKVTYLEKHNSNQVQIALDGFHAGIYFMVIEVEGQSMITKLNIQK